MSTHIKLLLEMKSTNRIIVKDENTNRIIVRDENTDRSDDNTDATETSPKDMTTPIELLLKMRTQIIFLEITTQIQEMTTQMQQRPLQKR